MKTISVMSSWCIRSSEIFLTLERNNIRKKRLISAHNFKSNLQHIAVGKAFLQGQTHDPSGFSCLGGPSRISRPEPGTCITLKVLPLVVYF